MIVFDASVLVSAALKINSIPERALLRAERIDCFALSGAVDAEIAEVLGRPKFARAIKSSRRHAILHLLRADSILFDPVIAITDCRDIKDNKYLELASAAGAWAIVSSDEDLLVLDPWRNIRIVRPADYLALTEDISRT